jgi:hypothetical protein
MENNLLTDKEALALEIMRVQAERGNHSIQADLY